MSATDILGIASSISTPLALGGITVAVVFLIARQVLALQIFPTLTKSLGAGVIRLIVDRLFVLALVSIVLAFLGFLAGFLPQRDDQGGPHEVEQAIARQALEAFYRHDFRTLYDTFTPSLRDNITFERFAAEHDAERSQFQSPPSYRRFERKYVAAGFLTITFLAEFDARSTFREAVVFARQGTQWQLWRFDIWPGDWPTIATSKVVTESKAGEILDHLKTLSEEQRTAYIRERYEGYFLQPSGWRIVVDRIDGKTAKLTCGVVGREKSSGAAIILDAVLGSCELPAQAELRVVGKVVTATTDQITVDAVRFSIQ